MTNEQKLDAAQTDSLALAIKKYGAVEVTPGRYAKLQEGDGWYTFEPYLFDDSERSFVRTERLGLANVAWMPAWWSPKQRKGLRHKPCGYVEIGLLTAVCDGCRQPTAVSCERVTADLETGAEVSA